MKNRLNIYFDDDLNNYLKARAKAEHRAVGNLAVKLLKEKMQDDISKEMNMKFTFKDGILTPKEVT
jgi:hypothetical protein